MKGVPHAPQCGFSRAVMQVLEIHDVDISKVWCGDSQVVVRRSAHRFICGEACCARRQRQLNKHTSSSPKVKTINVLEDEDIRQGIKEYS
jgi:glutaredoxin-related protein